MTKDLHYRSYILVILATLLAAAVESRYGSLIGGRPLYLGVVLYFSLFDDVIAAILALLSTGIAIHYTHSVPQNSTSSGVATATFIVEAAVFVALSWLSRRHKRLKDEADLKSNRIQKIFEWSKDNSRHL